MQRPFEKLNQIVRDKKIPIRYPRGYQQWKKKFDRACQETRGDVLKALEKIHGSTYSEGRKGGKGTPKVSPKPPKVSPNPSEASQIVK